MSEKDLENNLVAILDRSKSEPDLLRTLDITHSTSSARNLYDLVETRPFEIYPDTNDWNTQPKLMTDIAGGITPDIVIRSALSKQNRIYIEVKLGEELRDYAPLSQIVRQFLHLLGTSQFLPMGSQPDIGRRQGFESKTHGLLSVFTKLEVGKRPKRTDLSLDLQGVIPGREQGV